jgi:hypothetical protein
LSRNDGISEDQKRKLNGVRINADKELIAVSVTDSATFPLAKSEKKLDAFPPGHAATRIIPSAISFDGDHRRMSKSVKAGRSRYCVSSPVATAFF